MTTLLSCRYRTIGTFVRVKKQQLLRKTSEALTQLEFSIFGKKFTEAEVVLFFFLIQIPTKPLNSNVV